MEERWMIQRMLVQVNNEDNAVLLVGNWSRIG